MGSLPWRGMVVLGLSGCGGVSSEPDAAPTVDAAVDTPDIDAFAGRCDPTKPFANVTPVAGVNTDQWDSNPSLSPDELTIYFASIRQSPGTANGDLYVATRASRDDAFGPAVALAALNTTADERAVSIAPDGLAIYFHSSRSSNYDLWFSTRANTASPFDAPTALAALNTTDIETAPAVAANGQTLYFDRTPTSGAVVIWKSTLGAGGFGTPTMVTELSSATSFTPVIKADGLEIYFASDRATSQGNDIWVGTRASTSDPFSGIRNVTELNDADLDRPGWISPDGCRMYFSSVRTGGSGSFDIWQATRPQ